MYARLTVPDVIDRFRAYMKTGNALHIVLDDLNVADVHVLYCIEWAKALDDVEGEELARILLTMSKTQRAKIARKCRTP